MYSGNVFQEPHYRWLTVRPSPDMQGWVAVPLEVAPIKPEPYDVALSDGFVARCGRATRIESFSGSPVAEVSLFDLFQVRQAVTKAILNRRAILQHCQ
jgi:hypothetical protein